MTPATRTPAARAAPLGDEAGVVADSEERRQQGGRSQDQKDPALPEVDAALDEVLPPHGPTLDVPTSLTSDRSWITFTPTNYNPNLGQYPDEASLRSDLEKLYWQGWRGLITYTIDGTLSAVPRIAKVYSPEALLKTEAEKPDKVLGWWEMSVYCFRNSSACLIVKLPLFTSSSFALTLNVSNEVNNP